MYKVSATTGGVNINELIEDLEYASGDKYYYNDLWKECIDKIRDLAYSYEKLQEENVRLQNIVDIKVGF